MSNASSFKKFFDGKKVFIAGNTGFKGSWLTQILLNWNADIVGYALKPNTNPNLFSILALKDAIKNNFGDIREYEKLKQVMQKEKPEIVFHLAAQPLVWEGYDNPLYTYGTNIMGTANVLQAIREVNTVKSAIMITSDKVYDNKEGLRAYKETDRLGGYDPYSASKASAELVIHSYVRSFFNPEKYGKTHSTLVASARAGNVIGGGDWSKDRIVPDIVRSLLEKNEKITLRKPRAVRPWQHVLEPLIGYIMLSMRLYEGGKEFVGAWNFAPEERNFVDVETLVKKSIEIIKKGSYDVKQEKDLYETTVLRLDAAKAKARLGWKSILNIDDALLWTFNWYLKYYQEKESVTNEQISLFLDRF